MTSLPAIIQESLVGCECISLHVILGEMINEDGTALLPDGSP